MSAVISIPERHQGFGRMWGWVAAVVVATAVAMSVMFWVSRGHSTPAPAQKPVQVTNVGTGSAPASAHQAPKGSMADIHSRQVAP